MYQKEGYWDVKPKIKGFIFSQKEVNLKLPCKMVAP